MYEKRFIWLKTPGTGESQQHRGGSGEGPQLHHTTWRSGKGIEACGKGLQCNDWSHGHPVLTSEGLPGVPPAVKIPTFSTSSPHWLVCFTLATLEMCLTVPISDGNRQQGRVGEGLPRVALPNGLLLQVCVQVDLVPFLLVLGAEHGHCRWEKSQGQYWQSQAIASTSPKVIKRHSGHSTTTSLLATASDGTTPTCH